MQLKGALFGLIAAFALPAVASATDLYVPDDAYVAPADNAFDWDGFYVGVLGGAYTELGATGLTVSKVAGFNFVTDSLLFGVEAEALMWNYSGFTNYNFAGRGRVGLLLGDRALVYGTLGFADWTETAGQGPTAGAGVELALGDNLSARGDFQAIWYSGGSNGYFARGGLVWHAN